MRGSTTRRRTPASVCGCGWAPTGSTTADRPPPATGLGPGRAHSLRADLASESPSLSQALAMGNGRWTSWCSRRTAKRRVRPRATNLFIALATRVDPDSASRVNCGIGRFNLRQGRLLSEQIH
ncbi:MAG: hypothetical protein R3E68_21935 [Burkholderiaceae bacterium]